MLYLYQLYMATTPASDSEIPFLNHREDGGLKKSKSRFVSFKEKMWIKLHLIRQIIWRRDQTAAAKKKE